MVKVVNEILKDAKAGYKESIMIDNNIIEEKLLSIIGNAKFILNKLETNKKIIVQDDEEIKVNEIRKITKRVPLWLNKPHQYNSKILTAFMKLSENNKFPISISLLETHSDINDSRKFIAHFNQMKLISKRNHGKVFTEKNGQITLWKPIKDFIVSKF
jgi:hypothetical protein